MCRVKWDWGCTGKVPQVNSWKPFIVKNDGDHLRRPGVRYESLRCIFKAFCRQVGQNFLDSVQNNIISFPFLVSEGPVFGWCPMSVQPEPCSNEILDSPWTGSPRRVSNSGGHQEFFVSQQRLVCGWWTELKVGVFRPLLTIFFRKGWYAFPLPFTVSPSTSKCWCCHSFLFLSLNSVALTMCESLL